MTKLNTNFLTLPKTYLFSTIGEKVRAFKEKNSNDHLLNLGVGDIAFPLAPSIVESLQKSATEVGEHVHGYGPAEGELFLRKKILETCYIDLGLSTDEIFISDGIVRDICEIQDLFHKDAEVGIIDPTYPAYYNASVIAGRKIHKIPCLEENGFIPLPPEKKLDFVYLCTPNNPTGIAMTKSQLEIWVDWAIQNETVLLIDAAYEKFITSSTVCKTIYEIKGAKQVAIEFRSFSKSAGFTGLRLGYTVIPKEAFGLNKLWRQRQDIKTNGISYPIQKAGLHTLGGIGKEECDRQVKLYSSQAKKLKTSLLETGHIVYGGDDSPYIWWKIPHPNSFAFFDFLLEELGLITIPGSGFGPLGEGFIRLSSFISEATCNDAMQRLSTLGDKLCAMK